MKTCSKCGVPKDFDQFNKRLESLDGRRTDCRDCHSKKCAEYRVKNLSEIRQREIGYYRVNQKEIRIRRAAVRKQNPEQKRRWRSKSYLKNRDALLNRSSEYRKRNRVKIRATKLVYERAKLKTDPIYRLKLSLRTRLRVALHRYISGIKVVSAVRDLGCTVDEFGTYLELQFKPGMSWDNYGTWHVDHVRPLASFDLTDREQQRIAVHYSNLQPLWDTENMSKGSRWAGVDPNGLEYHSEE